FVTPTDYSLQPTVTRLCFSNSSVHSITMAMNEAKDRISQLENAIKRLDSVKKHLYRNASDIKAEIHANVSRNLECLRGREVSLLGQVDTVLGLKEETLQQQQARLNQALGILQTGLAMVLEDTAPHNYLADTLKKLDKVELSPEETPYISFRADHVGLRDSILNYGRVDSNGMPLITAFDDPGNPSASLPRHIEEYEDVDHHFFYKTLEEVRRSQNPVSCINVTIPKLSNRVEDWLQKKIPTTGLKTFDSDVSVKPVQPNPAVRPSTLAKAGEAMSVGLSRTSTPGSSCSLNNWLSIIKQHVDQEEEHDFEIIDHSVPNRASREADHKLWLAPNSKTPDEFKSNFFKHIPQDKKVWLLQFCQTRTNEGQHKEMFAHISKDLSTWLRSRAYAKNVSVEKGVPNFFSHISKDKSVWLLKQKQADKKVESAGVRSGAYIKDVEKWLMPKPINSSAVVNKDLPLNADIKIVEEPAAATEDETKIKSKDVFRPLNLPLHDWLSHSYKKQAAESPKNASFLDLGQHIRSTSSSFWLAKSSQSTTLASNQDTEKTREDKEIPKEPTSRLPAKASSSALDFCLSDWLLVPSELNNPIAEQEADKEKDESEGWSVCSDQTFTSSHHAQDVAAAREYLNKWVL
ncbi:hypothetical protein BgiMline_004249, partial [Biomphalaria glabrata]